MEPVREHEPQNGFLKKVRKIADEIKAVLVFDEITSGFRMKVGGVHELYGVYPDIVVYAKAISNGYPMAAIIGKDKIMETAQESFISSTSWTERVGPAAAIATIKKLKRNNVPTHLIKIGKRITTGWERIAAKYDLKIKTLGLPSLTTFLFDYGEDSQALHTLFNQEMLKRGFLASKSVYVSWGHRQQHVDKYLNAVDEVFAIIKRAWREQKINEYLKGPVAHKGFSRLT